MPSLPFAIQFGSAGDYKLWAGDGWHHDANDAKHTWAAHVAKLRLILEYTKDDLSLEIDVIPLRARSVEQELFVFLNGAFVAYWPVTEPSIKHARIEAGFLRAQECLFTFLSPRALCPRDAGISQDERVMGLAFRSLSLSVMT